MGLLLAEFGAGDSPCGASGVGAAAVATGASGLAAGCAITDATGSAEGADAAGCSVGDAATVCSAGAAVAAAAGSLAGVGAAVLVGLVEPVAPDEVGAFVGAFVTPADAVMSLGGRAVRRANSAQSQSVGLPSTRHPLGRSSWRGRQPNSAQSQTPNLKTSRPRRPTNLLTASNPSMTYLPRNPMTNLKPTTTS